MVQTDLWNVSVPQPASSGGVCVDGGGPGLGHTTNTALSFRAPSLIKGGPYSDCEDRPGTGALGGGIKSNAVLNTSPLVDIPPEVAVSTAQGGRTHKHGDVIQLLPSDCLWDTTCDPGAVIRLFVGHITCSRYLHQTVCETHHLIQVL
ncbi:unnamed protein product [Arctogadus glacialis]